MWKAAAGHTTVTPQPVKDDDDWETDPDFVNDVTEQEQRWGAKTIQGSGRTGGTIDMKQLREDVASSDALRKKKELEEGPRAAFGYGGKFGVQTDRMDQSAVGHDYVAKLEKHQSQKDYSAGFGGKYGVQTDRVDKSAAGWDHKEKIEKHASQKDYSSGFGGKFGVESDRQDKSAVGWDHVESVPKHESQKDYAVGFGGKFGVQSDRQDKSAVGWDHHEGLHQHQSQTDGKKGFGGKYGVESDRVDRSAHSFTDAKERVGTTYEKQKPDIGSSKSSSIRAKFESLAKQGDDESRKKAEEEREKRKAREQAEKESARVREEERLKVLRLKDEQNAAKLAQAKTPSSHTASVKSKEESEQSEKLPPSTVGSEDASPMPVPVTQNFAPPTATSPNPTLAVDLQEDDNQLSNTQAGTELEIPEEAADSKLTAIAVYDYQAAADDEISFYPDDIITNVEMIDEGWWRGVCHGRFGLFPANYVQIQE